MQRNQQRMRGFTLVELIVVILLVSILSVYAASRFSGISSVSAFAAQEQIISIIRQIQIDRMQSNLSSTSVNSDYALQITNHCIGSVQACSSANDDRRSDLLRNDELTFTSSPSLSVIEFSLLGNPLGGASNGVTINIASSANSTSLCLNSEGYVAKGSC